MSDELMKMICQRLDEIEGKLKEQDDHVVELYRRVRLLLQVDEEAADVMVKMTETQVQLDQAINQLTSTLRAMQH